jgi:dodecin
LVGVSFGASRTIVLDRNNCSFLWYGGVAGEGLRSVGKDFLPSSKSVCSILPIARRLSGRGFRAPAFMFGVSGIGPHIREAIKPGELGCKEAQIRMSVARVTELSATSETSFEDAINEAVARATSTLRGVEGAWVKDQNVLIEDGNITGYKVNVEVTFLLEE